MKNENLNPYPSGWFVAAFSHELKKGKVISKTFMGQEIVLFRTEAGVSSALDAHCPHLGAHLGHGGIVEGDCLRCPFHHFEFDTEGSCNKSKHLKANKWTLVERDGLIILYHGNPNKKHDLPNMIQEGWKLRGYYSTQIKSHPQQTMENNIDLAHFTTVHNVSAKLSAIDEKNGIFTGIYEFELTWPLFGRLWKLSKTSGSLELVGPGFSLVKTRQPLFGIEVAVLTSVTPLNGKSVHFKNQFFTKTIKPSYFFDKIILPFLSRIIFKQILYLLSQDLVIWEHQRYIVHPPLLPSESAIALFRKWVKKFYEE